MQRRTRRSRPFDTGQNHDATAIFAFPSGPRRPRSRLPRFLPWPPTARAQDSPDERRCTGQWRASNEERITSCTALINSGRYQPPNLAILHHDRGVALRAKGDIAGALSDFAEAIKLNPDYARAYADRGSARLTQHDLDGAIADLDTAIRLDANDAGAFMTRGNAFDEKARLRPRHRRLQRGHPVCRRTMPRPISIAGSAFRRKGDFDHAIADYDQAIRLDPKNASALNNRGIVWFEKGDFDRAIADYNLALRADANFAPAYNNRGDAWRAKNDLARALADFDRAIQLSPQFALAYDNRGLVYYQKRDYDHAIGDFDAAIRFDPNNADAYSNRGNAHDDKGDRNAAIADYNEAIRLDPKQRALLLRSRHRLPPRRRSRSRRSPI